MWWGRQTACTRWKNTLVAEGYWGHSLYHRNHRDKEGLSQSRPLPHLHLRLLSLELWDNHFSWFSVTSLVMLLDSSLRKWAILLRRVSHDWSKTEQWYREEIEWGKSEGRHLSWVLFSILVLGSSHQSLTHTKYALYPWVTNIPQSSPFWGDPNYAKIRRKFFICSTFWDHKADSCLLCIANLHITTLTMALRYVPPVLIRSSTSVHT